MSDNQGLQGQNADPGAFAANGAPDAQQSPADPNAPQQNYEELYHQAMQDNTVLYENLNQVQQQAYMASAQANQAAQQSAAQRWQQQERAFLQSVRDLPDEDREAKTSAFYQAQNQQVMGIAQQFVQQQVLQKHIDGVMQQYGLTDADRPLILAAHPSQMASVAYQLSQRNAALSDYDRRLQQVTANQVAQQMANSGAYSAGNGNVQPGATGAGEIKPGSREQLRALLGVGRP